MVTRERERVSWVVLVYRVPRQPSAPRIAIWRKLRSLGVVQLVDSVAALPEDARTREHLEWVADQVIEADGEALLLRSQALSATDERAMAGQMASARAEEYRDLTDRAVALTASPPDTPAERRRTLKTVRRELRSIQRRDYFPPGERDTAGAAVAELARLLVATEPTGQAETAKTKGHSR